MNKPTHLYDLNVYEIVNGIVSKEPMIGDIREAINGKDICQLLNGEIIATIPKENVIFSFSDRLNLV